MRLIRLDGWGPDGSDLTLDARLTVLVRVPAATARAVVAAVRALTDPSVVPPAGLVEVDRSLSAIRAFTTGPVVDPVVELRPMRRPPPRGGADGSIGSVAGGAPVDDPGADARRRSVARIEELQRLLVAAEADLRAAAARSGPAPVEAGRRAELEAAADQLSLVLLGPQADGPDEFCELEQRLRGLTHAADEAAIRAEATTWRIDEVRDELARLGDSLEADTERAVLVAELEWVRAELLELDRRGAVRSGERDRLAVLRSREAVLLDELGHGDYVTFVLDELGGAPDRPGRRDRVLAVRRELLDDELARLRDRLPDQVDAHAALRERTRLQSEAAVLLGIDVGTVRRFTVAEVADLLRRRSGSPDADGGLGEAVGRLVRALRSLGAEPPSGAGDPVELLAVARRHLAESATGPGPAVVDPSTADLADRVGQLRTELAEQERLLDALLAAVDEVDRLPVGVPIAGVLSGESPVVADAVRRANALTAGAVGPDLVPPLVLLVDPEPPLGLLRRLEELAAHLQCIVLCDGVSSAWRAIGDDAGGVVEW